MRRVLSPLVVLGLALATLAVGSGAASAAEPTCGTGYPVNTEAEIATSTTTPFVGESIEVSGTGYQPNEAVRLTIGGVFVGTGHTDASGSFDPDVTVPNLLGEQLLVGTGASGEACDVDSLELTIRAAAAEGGGGGGAAGGGGGGGLATTGVQIAAMVLLAAALIGGGAFFATAGRRRRSAANS